MVSNNINFIKLIRDGKFTIVIDLLRLRFLGLFSPEKIRFKGHYSKWRDQRIKCIVDYYGKDFFKGKKLLELGCGYGDIGAYFASLGAKVTCSDAKQEHLDVLKKRYPFIRVVRADLDNEWPFKEKFDIILHLGTLYHLQYIDRPLIDVCQSTKYLVLESEVCDSDDPDMIIYTKERGYDQAYNKTGVRSSGAYIERVLKICGMKFKRLKTSKYDTETHRYNWPIRNTGKWQHGLRRFWFAYKSQHQDKQIQDVR